MIWLLALLAAAPRLEAGRVEGFPDGSVLAEGGVRITWEGMSLEGESLRFDPSTGEVVVAGGAILRTPTAILRVRRLEGRVEEWEGGWRLVWGQAEEPVLVIPSGSRYVPDWRVEGDTISFSAGEWVVERVEAGTYDPVRRGTFGLGARRVRVTPGRGSVRLVFERPRARLFGVRILSWGKVTRDLTDRREGGLPGLVPVLASHADTGLRWGVASNDWQVGPVVLSGELVDQEHGEAKGLVFARIPIGGVWEVVGRYGSTFGSDPFGNGQWTRESPQAGLRADIPLGGRARLGLAGSWSQVAPEGDGDLRLWDAAGTLSVGWRGGRQEWRAWATAATVDGPGSNWSSGSVGVMATTGFGWGRLGLGAVLLAQMEDHPVPTRRVIESIGPMGNLLWTPGGGWGLEASGRWDTADERWAEARMGVLKTLRGLSVGVFWDEVRESGWLEFRLLVLP
ncbi:hypothetical protein IIA16_02230 [bacterium]|nr:hypothetical protein [bacterium]